MQKTKLCLRSLRMKTSSLARICKRWGLGQEESKDPRTKGSLGFQQEAGLGVRTRCVPGRGNSGLKDHLTNCNLLYDDGQIWTCHRSHWWLCKEWKPDRGSFNMQWLVARSGRNFRVVKMTGILKTEMATLASLWSCMRPHLFFCFCVCV